MHVSYFIPILIWFFPVCFGMVRAFFGARFAGKSGYLTSAGVWHGYGKGLYASLYVYLAEMILLFLFFLLYGARDLFGFISSAMISFLIYILFTMLIGLVFYTAPAFFGYGIGRQTYISILVEKEANKTRQEIENEIRAKQAFKRPLS